MRNIVEEIQNKYGVLTKSQRKIADFIVENYSIIPFETLREVAERIGLSTTSLIRFSRALGYEDYSDLKKSIQDSIKVKVSLPARLASAPEKEEQEVPDRLLEDCRRNAVRNIEETVKYISRDQLEQAVDWICTAKKIYVLGLRSCFSPAYFLAMVLAQIKRETRLIQGTGGIYPEEIIGAGDGDVGIVFSFPRFYKETLNIAHFLKRHGVRIILITGNQYEHIKQYGNIILPCYTSGVSFKDSFVAVFFLIDYIISKVASNDKEDGLRVISKIEEILSQNYFIGF